MQSVPLPADEQSTFTRAISPFEKLVGGGVTSATSSAHVSSIAQVPLDAAVPTVQLVPHVEAGSPTSEVSTSPTDRPFVARPTDTVQLRPTKQLCVAGSVSCAHASHEAVPSTHAVPVRHGSPACRLHEPPEQVSAPVQKRPSVHGSEFGLWVQMPAPSQTSVVQTSESSVHEVPSSSTESAGQPAAVPVQVSVGSQALSIDGRQTMVVSRNASAGHVAEAPVQLSAASQIPPDARQTVSVETNASVGHAASLPLQLSEMSHTPAVLRHSVVDGSSTSDGHAASDPVQLSGVSQTPADTRHACEDATNPSLGHPADVPLQLSLASQTPAGSRQTLVDATNASLGQSYAEP